MPGRSNFLGRLWAGSTLKISRSGGRNGVLYPGLWFGWDVKSLLGLDLHYANSSIYGYRRVPLCLTRPKRLFFLPLLAVLHLHCRDRGC